MLQIHINNPYTMLDTAIKINIQSIKKSRIDEVDFDNLPFGRIFSDHMYVADYKDGNWEEPSIIPYGGMQVTPAISGLHYGQCVFEGTKAYKSTDGHAQLFRPQANFKRINKSAKRLCMPEIPQEIFMQGLTELIKLDASWIPSSQKGSLYIRPLYFAVDEFIGVKPSSSYKFVIITCPVGAYYLEPVNVMVSTKYIRAFNGGVGEYKVAGNYAPCLVAAKEANQVGYHNMLWMNAFNPKLIEEIGTMNIFFVINDEVITPRLNGNILEGITRDSVITLLKDKGIKITDRDISIDEIVEAHEKKILQEAFGTGTAAAIAHIAKISYNSKELILPPLKERKIGPLLANLLNGIKTSEIPDKHNWVYQL